MNEEQEEICRKVRAIAKSLVKKGAEPSDISFALSLVATELGLKVTEGSISVFPVVMTGITHAVANAMEESADSCEAEDADVPVGATVH
ncbi:hypothetical protein BST95_09020 [Halioglobus japonicus]|uniref:Uncharacterized protein n=1 Tax=Halioglobus japonicus TaxID=930805 RepID=A0AAP8SN81_9GAMM|nr:hypothetical protein [Halioglobus japonicus]AQA18352.1 hypothetical protein BST95_09020 [Halioglobus japonicus]PLW86370.1 hypothetical protein C0029_08060 [Halioglobus japonicus]GHD13233.1 hypothetical protein GCM10007052_15140 [Halioglobus japonicus]